MKTRSSIAMVSLLLLGVAGCGTPRAHLIPGSDMAYPRSNGLKPLVAALTGTCLQWSPTTGDRTNLPLQQCASANPDSLRNPVAVGKPGATRP